MDLVQHVKRPLLRNNEDHEPTMPAEANFLIRYSVVLDPMVVRSGAKWSRQVVGSVTVEQRYSAIHGVLVAVDVNGKLGRALGAS